MKSQLYLWRDLRNLKKTEILLFKNTFKDKVFPVFENVEEEADALGDEIYNEFMNRPCSYEDSSIDPADIAEQATEASINYYENYSLMRYNTIAMWITMLYQYWEQQVRKFLYDEEKQYFEIEFKKFCTNGIKDIKKEFEFHNIEIEKLSCWKDIDELRLVCNTLKHGDGKSAQDLKNKRPDIFSADGLEEYDLLELYNTTLLEKVLKITDQDYYNYCDSLIRFWSELPEAMYSDELI